MAAEDFAYYASIVPGAILRLGCANRDQGIGWDPENRSVIGLHSPVFDIDEAVLTLGVKVFSEIVRVANRLPYFRT